MGGEGVVDERGRSYPSFDYALSFDIRVSLEFEPNTWKIGLEKSWEYLKLGRN